MQSADWDVLRRTINRIRAVGRHQYNGAEEPPISDTCHLVSGPYIWKFGLCGSPSRTELTCTYGVRSTGSAFAHLAPGGCVAAQCKRRRGWWVVDNKHGLPRLAGDAPPTETCMETCMDSERLRRAPWPVCRTLMETGGGSCGRAALCRQR